MLLSNTVDIAGREVDLALGGSDAEFTFSATTVWQDGAEAGIQFTEIPFDSFVHARNVVLQNTDEVEADLQQVRETCP